MPKKLNELNEADLPPSTRTNGSSFVEFWQSIPPIESSKTPLDDSQADVLLAETAGAWGKRSLDEIGAMIAEQRRQDWREEEIMCLVYDSGVLCPP